MKKRQDQKSFGENRVTTSGLRAITAPIRAVGLLALLYGGAASADMEDVGLAITKCFHPTAAYESIEIDETQKVGLPASIPGKVRFRGGITGNPYYMKFTLHLRRVNGETEMKVEPGVDTAPFPPNPNCVLRGWQ